MILKLHRWSQCGDVQTSPHSGESRCINSRCPTFTGSLSLMSPGGRTPVPRRGPCPGISGSLWKGETKSAVLTAPNFSLWQLPPYMTAPSHCRCFTCPVKRLCPRQGATSLSSQISQFWKSPSSANCSLRLETVPLACFDQCCHCPWSSLAPFTSVRQVSRHFL